MYALIANYLPIPLYYNVVYWKIHQRSLVCVYYSVKDLESPHPLTHSFMPGSGVCSCYLIGRTLELSIVFRYDF